MFRATCKRAGLPEVIFWIAPESLSGAPRAVFTSPGQPTTELDLTGLESLTFERVESDDFAHGGIAPAERKAV